MLKQFFVSVLALGAVGLVLRAAEAAPVELKVKSFSMSFVMDAPLEKIKGASSSGTGVVGVDDADLKSVKGTIHSDLSKITLHTFADETKNANQTHHMYNWFEIGGQVDKKQREKFTTAELKIDGAIVVEVPERPIEDKAATYNIKADATFTLHGISKKIPIELVAVKTPTGYSVKTAKALAIRLADFDVRPRDIAGKLMQITLESLGQKVAKDALVSIEMTLEK